MNAIILGLVLIGQFTDVPFPRIQDPGPVPIPSYVNDVPSFGTPRDFGCQPAYPYQPACPPSSQLQYLGSYNVPNYFHVYRPWRWVPQYSVQWRIETSGPDMVTGGQAGPSYGPSYQAPYSYPAYQPAAVPSIQSNQANPYQQQNQLQQVVIVPNANARMREALPTLEALRRKYTQEERPCDRHWQ